MDAQNYVAGLTEQEKSLLELARDHFGDTFHLESTIGYQEWMRARHPKPVRVNRKKRKRVLKIVSE